MKVVLVRVQVHNALSTPVVSFQRDTMTVNIKYSLLQSSTSNYDIAVKGKVIPSCGKASNKNKNKKNKNKKDKGKNKKKNKNEDTDSVEESEEDSIFESESADNK